MLKKVLIAVGALLALFLVAVSLRPSEFRIERKTTMAATPDIVYSFITDFHEWAKWSPWDKMDPGMKRTYSGPAQGPGAKYAWQGNDKVGEGAMTITGAKAPERVDIKLEFLKPFAATNMVIMSLKGEGAGTTMTWAMEGHNDFMMKAVGMFMDMDAMVGPDFERGLADLKKLAEAKAKEPPPAAEPASAPAPAPAPSPTPAPKAKK